MKMRARNSILLLVVLAMQAVAVSSRAGQRTQVAKSTGHTVQLLELYSSQGCSSCPPAEEWASGLKSQVNLWKEFVPVAFHVDYWDSLGWRDEWSSSAATARQRGFAAQWKNDAVYTPAFVLGGKEWRDWRKEAPAKALAVKDKSGYGLTIYRDSPSGFTVHTDGLKVGHGYIIRVVLLGMSLSSKVTAGENSGRTLKHDFVVLDLVSRSMQGSASDQKFDLQSAKSKTGSFAIAAWIEDENNLTPLQAAGGPLL